MPEASLFEGDSSPALNAGLMEELTAAHIDKLLTNPPTPTFMETNPKRDLAAKYAARRDVPRFMAVLDDMGLTLARKEQL